MKPPIYKTVRAAEFCNLLQRLDDAGINNAEVARRLGKTHGAISQIKSGSTNPTPASLELLRKIASHEIGHGGEILTTPEGEGDLREKLDDLEKHSPERFEAARATIEALHRGITKQEEGQKGTKGRGAGVTDAGISTAAAMGQRMGEKIDVKGEQKHEGTKETGGTQANSGRGHTQSTASSQEVKIPPGEFLDELEGERGKSGGHAHGGKDQ